MKLYNKVILILIGKRLFDKEKVNDFLSLLEDSIGHNLHSSAESSYDIFLRVVLNVFNECFPRKFIKPKPRLVKIKWIMKGIQISSKFKSLLHKQ